MFTVLSTPTHHYNEVTWYAWKSHDTHVY